MLGKILITLLFLISSFRAMPDTEWVPMFVTAEKATIFLTPDSNGEVQEVLSYGNAVCIDLVHSTDEWAIVDLENNQLGYVESKQLNYHLTRLPSRSLYLYYNLFLPNLVIWHQEEPQQECAYDYYGRNINSQPVVERDGKQIDANKIDSSLLDTLRNYLSLELVELADFKDEILPNPYAISTSYRPINNNESLDRNDFSLEIGAQKELVRYQDIMTEVLLQREYIGEIKELNAYVVKSTYEEPESIVVDKSTGKESPISNGTPYISPDGKYIVDFYAKPTYLGDYGTTFTVRNRRKESKYISVSFKSWMAVEEIEKVHWISNKELLILVSPIDNEFNYNHDMLLNNSDGSLPEKHYQWLKVKIL